MVPPHRHPEHGPLRDRQRSAGRDVRHLQVRRAYDDQPMVERVRHVRKTARPIPVQSRGAAGTAERMPVPDAALRQPAPPDAAVPRRPRSARCSAMGCFWGAEKKFWQLDGVYITAVGYAAGHTPNPTYREVCTRHDRPQRSRARRVRSEGDHVTSDLLKVFWENHDPTQGMRQGNDVGTQYRSGIYYYDEDAAARRGTHRATLFQQQLTAAGYGAITTEILPAPEFYYAEDYHQQYLAKNPDGYCGLGGTGVSCPVGVGTARVESQVAQVESQVISVADVFARALTSYLNLLLCDVAHARPSPSIRSSTDRRRGPSRARGSRHRRARRRQDDARAAGAGGRRSGHPAAAAPGRRARDRGAHRRRARLDARPRGRLAGPLRAPLHRRHAAARRHRRHPDRAAADRSAPVRLHAPSSSTSSTSAASTPTSRCALARSGVASRATICGSS